MAVGSVADTKQKKWHWRPADPKPYIRQWRTADADA
jgi:hypothetical protein